ncbi:MULTISPECIES: SAM-dependent methyltransferase [Streptomyces]|uniref:SAM-dependent methyltransferase n=1 Tax=Streptomyces TaxID=1883 RepID=UPI0015F7FCB0|nr:SAM-dependent methyltransferase [Streptomyces sp. GMR22]MBA6435826.1 SAM-dependent methyltransferase [Streptomyces sp. GMR22]
MTDNGLAPDQIDTTKPHPARMYDFYLNGKDHYEVDAEAAGRVLEVYPTVRLNATVNRAFIHRATRWLSREAGVRQFLDIGTGIPTEPNLHQVAQSVAPEARVVYTDYDPIVLAYAQALLVGTPEGRTAYVQSDVRDPQRIMSAPELHETLDLDQPVAISVNALFHFIPDEDKPYEIIRELMAPLVPGSYLMLTHSTHDFSEETWRNVIRVYKESGISFTTRSQSEVGAFFDGLELIDPGVSEPHHWNPDPEDRPESIRSADINMWAGVARKP